MRTPFLTRKILAGFIAAVTALGCNINVTVAPPPEAILAGKWKLTGPNDTGDSGQILEFNEVGHLVSLAEKIGDITVVSRDVHRQTKVNGVYVLISTTRDTIFEGNLNDARNVATGTVRTETTIGSTTVIKDQGPATITKQ